MSPVLSTISSSKLYVPPELLSHIFSFCPPSSLAAITRSNFACLELASSFLYRSVRLEGGTALKKYFGGGEDSSEDAGKSSPREDALTDPKPPQADRISKYLSLSQTKHLTFLGLEADETNSVLSQRRLPSSLSLSLPLPLLVLSTLTLSLPLPPTIDFEILVPPLNTLLSLTSPQTFHLLGRQPSHEHPHLDTSFAPFLDISSLPWNRLQTVVLTNSSLHFHPAFTRSQYGSSLLSTFDVVLNLADSWDRWQDDLAQGLVGDACEALRYDQERGLEMKVLVLVDTEERNSWFEEMMVDFAEAGVSLARLKENLPVRVKASGVEGSDWEVMDLTLTRAEQCNC